MSSENPPPPSGYLCIATDCKPLGIAFKTLRDIRFHAALEHAKNDLYFSIECLECKTKFFDTIHYEEHLKRLANCRKRKLSALYEIPPESIDPKVRECFEVLCDAVIRPIDNTTPVSSKNTETPTLPVNPYRRPIEKRRQLTPPPTPIPPPPSQETATGIAAAGDLPPTVAANGPNVENPIGTGVHGYLHNPKEDDDETDNNNVLIEANHGRRRSDRIRNINERAVEAEKVKGEIKEERDTAQNEEDGGANRVIQRGQRGLRMTTGGKAPPPQSNLGKRKAGYQYQYAANFRCKSKRSEEAQFQYKENDMVMLDVVKWDYLNQVGQIKKINNDEFVTIAWYDGTPSTHWNVFKVREGVDRGKVYAEKIKRKEVISDGFYLTPKKYVPSCVKNALKSYNQEILIDITGDKDETGGGSKKKKVALKKKK